MIYVPYVNCNERAEVRMIYSESQISNLYWTIGGIELSKIQESTTK
jgi:hypothetical protein